MKQTKHTATMATILPSRLLTHSNGHFALIIPDPSIPSFDIISYRWGTPSPPYIPPDISGITWNVTISLSKLTEIKSLMITAGIKYLWCDCVCINQEDPNEKSREIANMYQYYMFASRCHILLDMDQVWNPQQIVDNLKLVDHVRTNIDGSEFATQSRLSQDVLSLLNSWAEEKEWSFPVSKSMVRSAGVELGLLNCYSTSTKYVRSVFRNLYFSRVWTFQEMILGKNITMWGVQPGNAEKMECIGPLTTWMDLAIDAADKADKLFKWIDSVREGKNPMSVNAILSCIAEDDFALEILQTQVKGIESARTDIISGGPEWWRQNYKGVANVFSAVSIQPRECGVKADLFRGLLGVFAGLFTPEEISQKMSGDDMDLISLEFFKQLSIKTERAWTRLALSGRERQGKDFSWIPVVPRQNTGRLMTTDLFAGVVNLGEFKNNASKGPLIRTMATTGLVGVPRDYMRVSLRENEGGQKAFRFKFRGCNAGKELRTGRFMSTQPIPVNEQVYSVVGDQTGRALVECATMLGFLLDPGKDTVEYRNTLLNGLRPLWAVSDRSAKPPNWVDRCVSGTPWENPTLEFMRVHNQSMHYDFTSITQCRSRLHNDTTATVTCELTVNCGCRLSGPFSLMIGAITSVHGSFLGKAAAELDKDNRIILSDGLGLVQVGDAGKDFKLVAFGGDPAAHLTHATACRKTREGNPVIHNPPLNWPTGRALVNTEFNHGAMDSMKRDYGYVDTYGSGNLLICRNNPLGDYAIIGVCIDDSIQNKKGQKAVTIQ
ncbi:heterokaryon incompatibility protein-domain-containing protein [Podospora fimiseda]|uniref:Heterokaryon incompatibility protein-domain-containing protein n=1 Tax=Podospora fimiseda TaxID=252190 RepID=A0AAN7BJ19_9PEZI|nr:heterokaryon incompatibility protein-domain-containing protein [Podospora fimiseda]